MNNTEINPAVGCALERRVRHSHYAVIFTHLDARQVVLYTRPVTDVKLAKEVAELRRKARRNGYESAYSIQRMWGTKKHEVADENA